MQYPFSVFLLFKKKRFFFKTKETKTLVSEYFDKLLIIKALNPILYKTLDLKLNEFFNKYKDVKLQDLNDEQKMLKDDDLINLNVNLFKNIITLPKHYNNFFLVVVDGIYKELYVLNKEKQNLLLYPDKLTSLYYKLRLLKITTDYENDLWLSLNFYLEEQVPSNKLNTIMASSVAELNKIEKELSNKNYSNIKKSSFYKVFELIPPAKFDNEPCNDRPTANPAAPKIATNEEVSIPSFEITVTNKRMRSVQKIRFPIKFERVNSTLRFIINFLAVLVIKLVAQSPTKSIITATTNFGEYSRTNFLTVSK